MKKPIKKSYKIYAKIDEIWSALVDPEYIKEWGACPCIMEAKKGTEFTLWEGDIHGKNIEVVPKKKLVQEWYSGDWSKPSIVSFTLKPGKNSSLLELEHTGVPDDEYNDIDTCWDDYYLAPIKEYLEKKAKRSTTSP